MASRLYSLYVKNVEYCRENIIKFKKGVEMMDKNNVFIIGDSYSTYDGYIPKKGLF